MPGRCARTPGEPAGRAGRRGQRRRPAAPHDPARHELWAHVARRRARGRRRRPRHRLRVRGFAPETAVRVREDPVAERRDLHRCTAGGRSPRGTSRAARTRSRSRSGRSGDACRRCRRSWSREAASTASPPACAPCAGSESSRRRRSRGIKLDIDRPLETTGLRAPIGRSRRAGSACAAGLRRRWRASP